MYPLLFGVLDMYLVMMIVAFIVSLLVFFLFLKRKKYNRNEIIDILLCGIVAITTGVIFAILFQNFYDLIYYGSAYKWTWGMTFYGGVIGGAFGFILMYNIFYKKIHSPAMKDILVIAPGCITLAHSIGRLGCFFDGCCYGKPTDSVIGVVFPVLEDNIKRIPTQLIESIFLLLLSIVLLVFAFKQITRYTFTIYIVCYAIFRFVLEFFRGDYRGKMILGLSPSQIICILLLLLTPVITYLLHRYIFKKEDNDEKDNS